MNVEVISKSQRDLGKNRLAQLSWTMRTFLKIALPPRNAVLLYETTYCP